jgi:hypothetical protein
MLLRYAIPGMIRATSGVGSSVRHVYLDVSKGRVRINDLEVFNPRGFKDRTLAKVSAVTADFEWKSIITQPIHFKNITVMVSDTYIVRNKNKEVNVETVTRRVLEPMKKDPSRRATRIDNFDLTVKHVHLADYTTPAGPLKTDAGTNLRVQQHNVRDLMQLIKQINDGLLSSAGGDITKPLQNYINKRLGL